MRERCYECNEKFGEKRPLYVLCGIPVLLRELERADPDLDFCEECMDDLEIAEAKRLGEFDVCRDDWCGVHGEECPQ